MGDGVLLSKLINHEHGKVFPPTKNGTNTNQNKESQAQEQEQEEKQAPTIYEINDKDELESFKKDQSRSYSKIKRFTNESLSSMENVKAVKSKSRKSRNFSLIRFLSLIPWSLYDFTIRFLLLDNPPVATPISVGYRQQNEWEGKVSRSDNRLGFAHACSMAVSNRLDLNQIKQLSQFYGGTINDFVVSLFCSAVNKYMKKIIQKHNYDSYTSGQHSELTEIQDEDDNNNNSNNSDYWNILKRIYGNDFYIRFVSVFNLRSLMNNDLNKLLLDFANGEFDNEIAMVALRLPIGDMSFSRRFSEVKSFFWKMKFGPMPILGGYIIKFVYLIGGIDLVVYLMEFTANKCNIMLSNLTGPKMYLGAGNNFNNKVWNIFNITNPTNLPITCGVMSYVDNITFTVAADVSTIESPKILVDCIHDEFERLCRQYQLSINSIR